MSKVKFSFSTPGGVNWITDIGAYGFAVDGGNPQPCFVDRDKPFPLLQLTADALPGSIFSLSVTVDTVPASLTPTGPYTVPKTGEILDIRIQ